MNELGVFDSAHLWGVPKVDFWAFTVPYDRSAGLLDNLLVTIAPVRVEGSEEERGVYRTLNQGTFFCERKGPVQYYGFSGGACGALRAAGLFVEVLSEVACFEHKVTSIHIAVDDNRDGPSVVRGFLRRLSRGDREFSRSSLWRGKPFHSILSPSLVPPGRHTGSIYVGWKQAVTMVVYDKRQERVQKGFADPGCWSRFELRLRQVLGVSLRDVALPSSLFWHYNQGVFFPEPVGVSVWVPGGVGFVLPERVERSPYERLVRYCGTSEAVAVLARLVVACGPCGPKVLLDCLQALSQASSSKLGV